jgi:hypothetical protein
MNNTYLIVIAADAADRHSEEIKRFMRPGDSILACCHVMDTTYAIKTNRAHPEVYNNIVKLLGEKSAFIVAPINENWSQQNAVPAFRCFRGDDDD